MVGENGHVRRLDTALSASERAALLGELDRLVADHRQHDGSLALPRAMTLVTATVRRTGDSCDASKPPLV
jgi:hypothetical protein